MRSCRTSYDKLSRYRRIGLIVIGPLVLVEMTYLVVSRIPGGPSTKILVSSVLFLMGTLFFLSLFGLSLRGIVQRSLLRIAIFASVTFALVFVLGRSGATRLDPLFTISVIIAAICEELVFRSLLPRALIKRMGVQSKTGWGAAGAIGLAQLSFAACHFVAGPVWPLSFTSFEFFRLFTAGLVYTELVAVSGIGMTALIHALVNLLPYITSEPAQPPSVVLVLFMTGLALVLLLSRLFPTLGTAPRALRQDPPDDLPRVA